MKQDTNKNIHEHVDCFKTELIFLNGSMVQLWIASLEGSIRNQESQTYM